MKKPARMQGPIYRDEPLALFSASEMDRELQRFSEGIIGSAKTKQDVTEEDWAVFMFSLRSCFGCSAPESDTVTHALDGSEPHLVLWLKSKVDAVREQLQALVTDERRKQGGFLHEEDLLFLLPVGFPARFDMLIGEGRLQVAKVEQYDLLRK